MGMAHGKRLDDLLAVLESCEVRGDVQTVITGVSYDSRQVTEGSLFACWQGEHEDGHDYLDDAVAQGARAALVERWQAQAAVPQVRVTHVRRAMAQLAAEFFDHPSRALTLVGVTGTNGKTTTSFLTRGVLECLGWRTGLIGTIENRIGDRRVPGQRTTPEAPDLQALLARMRDAGCTHGVMEVSSHALALDRVVGCSFDVGVFTNLTHDHLDFHQSLDAYFAAKRSLLVGLKPGRGPHGSARAAVINADDGRAEQVGAGLEVPVWWYTRRQPGAGDRWLRAAGIRVQPAGNRFTLQLGEEAEPVIQHLAGPYNVENALAAAAVGLALGGELSAVAAGLASVKRVPGRFEAIDAGQPFTVVVDYAHTPDGLANLLEAARATTDGRIITVFGCGGDRDPGKRPRMGQIAVGASDHVVITSDNPRTEDPGAIIEAILDGVRQAQAGGARRGVDVEPDRAAAIARAVDLAGEGDMVIIAGKGHETYQVFADETVAFDDREVARSVLRRPSDRHRL